MGRNDRILMIIASIAFFMLVSIPSIKILYSSSVINVIPLFLFLAVSVLGVRRKMIVTRSIFNVSVIVLSLGVLFFLYAWTPDSYLDEENIFKYLFFLLYLLLLIRLRDMYSVSLIGYLILIWGIFLAIGSTLGVIQTREALNQTYLTLGLPIGAALTVALIHLNISKKKSTQLIFLFCAVILIYALLSSRGRSNLIYPFVTTFLFLIRTIFANKERRLYYIILLLISGGILTLALDKLSSNKEFVVFSRIERAQESTGEESRTYLWGRTIDLIYKNPLGYGLDSYKNLTGFYPHNIFLETTLSFGVFGLLLIVSLIIIFIKRLRNQLTYLEDPPLVVLGFVAIYFLMIWNTSFDFATSYIPLSAIVLFYLKSSKKDIQKV